MKKLNIIFYGVSALFALVMAASGFAKLSGQEALVTATSELGYPLYLLKILGFAYLIGAVSILQLKFELLRQWGYAGFAIAMIGAAASHLMAGQVFSTAVPALILLIVLVLVAFLNEKLKRN